MNKLPMNITYIQKMYTSALEHAKSIIDVSKWKIIPNSTIGITRRKRAYGLAFPNGNIEINQFFIGSNEYAKLKSTIMHEISHMIVGLENNHNKLFKSTQCYICVDYCEIVGCSPENEVRIANKPPMWLVAILDNGLHCDIVERHKKHTRYTNYDPTKRKSRLLEHPGCYVVSFYYRDNI